MDTGNNLLLNVLQLVDELYAVEGSDTSLGVPGHPYVYPERKLFKAATVATLKKKKTPCEVYRFLRAHPRICQACALNIYPRWEIRQKKHPSRSHRMSTLNDEIRGQGTATDHKEIPFRSGTR